MTRKNLVKIWVALADSSFAQIAEKIGVSKQNLDYHMKSSKDLDEELFLKIKNIIPREIIEEVELPMVELKKANQTNAILLEKIEEQNKKLAVQFVQSGAITEAEAIKNKRMLKGRS